jgi:hypothetical protein
MKNIQHVCHFINMPSQILFMPVQGIERAVTGVGT